MSRLKLSVFALLTLLFISACVTINVYFPAAAAEQAADRIIQEVWKEKQEQSAPAPAPKDKASGDNPAPSSALPAHSWLAQTLNLVISPAYAEADFNVSSPAINALKTRMTSRFTELNEFYRSGAIGLTKDALVTVRDLNAASLRARNKLQSTVAAENQDRLALYQEIADANGHPEWVNQIRQTFAERWVSNAQRGWWYQNAAGQWLQKN